ncbi:Hypothetical_protein [Hexamita inflata]|uniref:Hypothetical_protein n=1 Tax=Hexamita inflata TaxID=28002 RepID=A0AA86UZ84_9EUKA|nr:Hypothetical protein HINF_LOCUS57961 [Hexamita inflata]
MEIQVGQYLRALQITCANQLMRLMTVEMNAYYLESQLSLRLITFMARVRIIYNIVFTKLFFCFKALLSGSFQNDSEPRLPVRADTLCSWVRSLWTQDDIQIIGVSQRQSRQQSILPLFQSQIQ